MPGPAAMPKYQRIAAALRQELARAALDEGGRLPSERSLAARYGVNRQTVRAALQQLRADGLVVTGKRGTRPAPAAADPDPRAPAPAATGPAPRAATATDPAPRGVAAAAGVTQGRLTLVTVPPSFAAPLGMRGGERTLVHHHRELGPAGETRRHAVTYLSPHAVARNPELADLRERVAVRDLDLAPLERWLERARAQGRTVETLTMTRTTHPPVPAASAACGLTVRRALYDSAGRLLALTDLAFPAWDRLTFHRDRTADAFRVM
ncbi:GntR family transcriptional regulator [Streptomyces sp. NPDC046161]|uniref:winged helix-turn-helix domain-containing protein n=1 Tax=Streptomyces sp. NPDC046161 TaxID=3155132 RepID=UPI0033EBD4E5